MELSRAPQPSPRPAVAARARNWSRLRRAPARRVRRYRALGLKAIRPLWRSASTRGSIPRTTRSARRPLHRAGPGKIRYTTDGADPTPSSLLWPAAHTGPAGTLKAAAFLKARPSRRRLQHQLRHALRAPSLQSDLTLRSDKVGLNLEGQWPVHGPRPVFMVDIINPCWIYQGADLTGSRTLRSASAAFPSTSSRQGPRPRFPCTRRPRPGRAGGAPAAAHGPPIAVLPLATAAGRAGQTTLTGALPALSGAHDLSSPSPRKGSIPCG